MQPKTHINLHRKDPRDSALAEAAPGRQRTRRQKAKGETQMKRETKKCLQNRNYALTYHTKVIAPSPESPYWSTCIEPLRMIPIEFELPQFSESLPADPDTPQLPMEARLEMFCKVHPRPEDKTGADIGHMRGGKKE